MQDTFFPKIAQSGHTKRWSQHQKWRISHHPVATFFNSGRPLYFLFHSWFHCPIKQWDKNFASNYLAWKKCQVTLLPLQHPWLVGCFKCDQIGRFIGLWVTFQSLWQQLFCPNHTHFRQLLQRCQNFSFFLVESFLEDFYRHLATFYWLH